MALQIHSRAFEPRSTIPKRHTKDGEDASPPLTWEGAPAQTRTLALIVDDPDAPSGTFVHWVVYNIPSAESGLHEGIQHRGDKTEGTLQGRNDFGELGYGGPYPPPGPAHRYHFKLYALDSKLELNPGASKSEVEEAMRGHILDQAELVGLYAR